MSDFYLEIRLVHITAVMLSGGLFLLRGLALNAGADWAMAPPVRVLGHTIDIVLLTAALMLMTIVRQYPGTDGWLTMKVALLVVYVVLGSFALKRGKTRAIRIGCFVAALLVFGFIVSIARAHDPLGILAGLAGG
jgi:uncharacterized membrane protein SirB2